MRQFHCPACRSSVFFEQGHCTNCGAELAFGASGLRFRPGNETPSCLNRPLIGCNWATGDANAYCSSCSLTRTIPPLQSPRNVMLWRRVEEAKRRLLYDLARLKLPLRDENTDWHIAFDILADDLGQPVMTGHLNGLITLSLSEADDAEREARRTQFREPYRTLLGHFRHEVGHFYWELLVDGTTMEQPFRLIFGDETVSYQESIKGYHARVRSHLRPRRLHQRICDLASLGRLGGELRAFLAHRLHARFRFVASTVARWAIASNARRSLYGKGFRSFAGVLDARRLHDE